MKHNLSPDGARFCQAFESGQVPPAEFNNRAHVHLAFACLVGHDPMLTHPSAALLFSDEARASFVEPDASPISRYP